MSELTTREICVGCSHDIGRHFNDVTGVARCLWQKVQNPFGMGIEVLGCPCSNFEMPPVKAGEAQ